MKKFFKSLLVSLLVASCTTLSSCTITFPDNTSSSSVLSNSGVASSTPVNPTPSSSSTTSKPSSTTEVKPSSTSTPVSTPDVKPSSTPVSTSVKPSSTPSSSSSSSSSTTKIPDYIEVDYPELQPKFTRTGVQNKNHNIVIYHVNDVHGAIESNPSSYQMGLSNIRDVIYSDPDFDPDYSVILSAGDMFQGSGISNLTKGVAMTRIMNSFPFDAMTVGNHEFDWGLENVLERVSPIANFPFLANNIFHKGTDNLVDNIVPSTMIERGGYKIGVVGSIQYGIDSSIAYNNVKNFDIRDDYALSISEAQKLRSQGADFVFLLTHQGETSNVMQLASSDVFDACLLGHTHTLVDFEVTNSSGKTVPIIEARANSQAISKMVFNASGYVSHTILLATKNEIENMVTSSDMANFVKACNNAMNEFLLMPVAQTDGPFTRYSYGGQLGTLITKMMYDYGVENGLTNVVAVHNTGGVRADFTCSSSPCTMTYGNIYQISPFDNEVRFLEVSGYVVKNQISKHFMYGYNPTTGLLLNGQEIDISATYTIVTIDYLTTTPGYPLYREDGGSYINGKVMFIRDLLVEMLSKQEGIIHTADYQNGYIPS